MSTTRMLALLLTASAVGCSSGTGPSTASLYVGHYQLFTVDGSDLPHTFFERDVTRTIDKGTLAIRSDLTWREVLEVTIEGKGSLVSLTLELTGKWWVQDNRIIFDGPDLGIRFSGRIVNNVLVVQDGNLELIFAKG